MEENLLPSEPCSRKFAVSKKNQQFEAYEKNTTRNMRTSIKALIPVLVILALLSMSACSTKSAPVFVGYHHKKVEDYFSIAKKNPNNDKFRVDSRFSKDTILFSTQSPIQHVELLYLFKNDTCNYQEIKLYCGPCTDKMIAKILKDKDYQFKAIDMVNYISRVNPKIIMRMNTGVDKDSLMCNSIYVRKI